MKELGKWSSGYRACLESMRTSVQIPNTHVEAAVASNSHNLSTGLRVEDGRQRRIQGFNDSQSRGNSEAQ